MILKTFQSIGDIFLYGLLFYTMAYMSLSSLRVFGKVVFSLDLKFFLFIAMFSCVAFLFSFFRSILSILSFGILFIFLFIFLSVNF
jgi:hypothetical protein